MLVKFFKKGGKMNDLKFNTDSILEDSFLKKWDPDKFDWEKNSYMLPYKYYDKFNIWWNPNKFNWKTGSYYLARYCYHYFIQWWDKNKFNYEKGIQQLYTFCFEYINMWYDFDILVKYLTYDELEKIIEKNNELQLLDKSEIIKLILYLK